MYVKFVNKLGYLNIFTNKVFTEGKNKHLVHLSYFEVFNKAQYFDYDVVILHSLNASNHLNNYFDCYHHIIQDRLLHVDLIVHHKILFNSFIRIFYQALRLWVVNPSPIHLSFGLLSNDSSRFLLLLIIMSILWDFNACNKCIEVQ